MEETQTKEKKTRKSSTETQDKLLAVLTSEGKTIDVILQETGLNVTKAKTTLRNMEAKGLCRRDKSVRNKMVFFSA